LNWCAAAFLVVSIGALIGLLVKYITERLTPQAALVRRLGALKRSIGYIDQGSTVPVTVRVRIEDLEDNIARSEYAKVEESFVGFDQEKAKIAAVSQQFGNLLDQLDRQRISLEKATHLSPADRRLLESTLEAEFRLIQTALFRPWPDQEQYIIRDGQETQLKMDVAEHSIEKFLRNPSDSHRRPLYGYQRGLFPTEPETYPSEQDVDQTRDEGSAKKTKQMRDESRIFAFGDLQPISPIFRHARTIAAFASVIVVSIAGLKSQYLDAQDFNGAVSDWFKLLIWGLVVELSGVSVLDVLGRLTNTPVTPATRGQSAK